MGFTFDSEIISFPRKLQIVEAMDEVLEDEETFNADGVEYILD